MPGTSNGDFEAPWFKAYQRKVEKLRRKYWEKQKSSELNALLIEALSQEKKDKDYVEKAKFIPTGYIIAGFHYATEVLISSEDDFRKLPFGFSEKVDIDKYICAVIMQGGINPQLLKERPFISLPSEGRNICSVELLREGFHGWFSEKNIEGKKEPTTEISDYKIEIRDWNLPHSGLHLAFYARRTDGRIGWTYFPVRKEDRVQLEEDLAKIRRK